MNIRSTLSGALRRIAGSSFVNSRWPLRQAPPAALASAGADTARRTVPLPTIFAPGAPTLVRAGVMPKPSPANLRRFAEMPIARKAINTIKDGSPAWGGAFSPAAGQSGAEPAGTSASPILTGISSSRTRKILPFHAEQALEDLLVGGFGAIEMELTGDPGGPCCGRWTARPSRSTSPGRRSRRPLRAGTGRIRADKQIPLADDELMYIRLNPRTHTPFGLGRLEVAFETVNQFSLPTATPAASPRTPSCNMRCG